MRLEIALHPTKSDRDFKGYRYHRLGSVVRRVDSAIQQINHYPVDKC